MEWYMCRDGVMIVPRDQEHSEQPVSQDNSFQWEEGLSPRAELPTTNYGIWDSENRVSGDWLDYQFNCQSGIDQMNDNFMGSFLEKDSPQELNSYQPYQSAGLLPAPQCSRMPFDNHVEDMGINSRSSSQAQSPGGNFKYLEVASSMDWDKLEDSQTYTPYDSKKSMGEPIRNAQASETNMGDGQVNEETLLEEDTIHDLEVAMTRMTGETRLCVRDALYRLANSSSKQHESQRQCGVYSDNERYVSKFYGETSRFGKEEQMGIEMNQNTIDSTVTHLIFSEKNSYSANPYNVSPKTHLSHHFI